MQESVRRPETVRPRIDIITLAVSDLDRAVKFYRDLGLKTQGIVGSEFPGSDTEPAGATAMFQLDNGMILSVYPRTELAKDGGVPLQAPASGEFSIGHFVETREAVDALLATAEAGGGTVTDRAHERPWGIYSGYFRDPDGHLWEIIFNPQAAAPDA